MTTTHQQPADRHHQLRSGNEPQEPSVVGAKIALTSRAAQARVGATAPIWGWLTDAMELANGSAVAEPHRVRVEAELVFRLGKDLRGPAVTVDDVLAATEAIHPGLELPAKRDDSMAPKIDDLLAANAMAKHFVLGAAYQDWAQLDLPRLGVVVEVDGLPVHLGSAANVLGNPASAIAVVANAMAACGQYLRAGQIVFTGGMAPAVDLQSGSRLEAHFAHLGTVCVCAGWASRMTHVG